MFLSNAGIADDRQLKDVAAGLVRMQVNETVKNLQNNELLRTCEDAARAGGRELLSWRGRFQAREKGVSDFVTDADLASQEAIQSLIRQRFPEHEFVGEESKGPAVEMTSDKLKWIVDPLDGTTNYLHGYPHFAVSVAVTCGNDILAGVTINSW